MQGAVAGQHDHLLNRTSVWGGRKQVCQGSGPPPHSSRGDNIKAKLFVLLAPGLSGTTPGFLNTSIRVSSLPWEQLSNLRSGGQKRPTGGSDPAPG